MAIAPQEALLRCIEHREIFHDEMLELMRSIMRGELSSNLTSALLVGLRTKKETIGEITAAAMVMREFANQVQVADKSHFVDIVGTGGDGSHSFNISTTAMFVVAAAGAKVAKHGNRGVSSKSGSADVLESLGVSIQLSSEQVAQCLAQTGIGFMFAPNHHPAMKNVAAVRKELGIRTIFNILGPKHALVVYGKDGLDEISLGASTLIGELKNNEVIEYEIHPEDFGLSMVGTKAFKVASPAESQTMLLNVLNNVSSPALDIVCLNAGAALYAADISDSIQAGIDLARSVIADGSAKKKLDAFIQTTQQLSSI